VTISAYARTVYTDYLQTSDLCTVRSVLQQEPPEGVSEWPHPPPRVLINMAMHTNCGYDQSRQSRRYRGEYIGLIEIPICRVLATSNTTFLVVLQIPGNANLLEAWW